MTSEEHTMSDRNDDSTGISERERMVDYLRQAWVGPADGEEEVLTRSPIYAYLVGTLYPVEKGEGAPSGEIVEELSPLMEAAAADHFEEDFSDEDDPSDEVTDEDEGLNITGAFGWAPQSFGMSFIHDGDGVRVSARAGLYSRVQKDQKTTLSSNAPSGSDDQKVPDRPPADLWQREQVEVPGLILPNTLSGRTEVLDGRAMIAWRSRSVGGRFLTTVAISNNLTTDPGKAKSDPASCLFQVSLHCQPQDGVLHPYPTSSPANTSDEEGELELRYRNELTYGIGHGTAVDWEAVTGAPHAIFTESTPTQEVPAIRPSMSSSPYLELKCLADENTPNEILIEGLRSFAAGYEGWLDERVLEAAMLPEHYEQPAERILSRMHIAKRRIAEGIDLLEQDELILTAFRLANGAMRTQMLQQRLSQVSPGRLGTKLPVVAADSDEPRWRPFQLGFILLALSSTVDETHENRELVDLIWFPTGGGKTEAYLGLAAIEMIRRRLKDGVKGGGTAVLTRYTMRLLTAQQFQRTATLVCALELLRKSDSRLRNKPAFSVGLWLGNTTTPPTFRKAAAEMKATYKDAIPENRFQVRQCSWCGTPILPTRRTARHESYGIRATNYEFTIFCPHTECPFNEKLPVQVVDEAIYQDPPTILVATVDKFARLAWIEQGSSLFGLGGVPYEPPSLVIQDELHLITGPLGTVVGVYEAAIRGLMSWNGHSPKVVASTATIRAAEAQVNELMASPVAVFPPSGLNADDNYYSEPDPDTQGRLYLGIMPQAHTPSWAIGQISTELLQAPIQLGLSGASLDAYWTLIVYHNSLRELGRTVTILRDDVKSALERRRSTSEGPVRELVRAGIDELNGNVKAEELIRILDQLSAGPDDGEGIALDALATTNIMSVGIDVSRLGLMLVNGHPKSTSEYIQATSRVGRGTTPGLVVTTFRSGKPRDRSVFETFGTYHRSYYRFVEPSSVTPWSLQARRRALRAALVILLRHAGGLLLNSDARRFTMNSLSAKKAIDTISAHVAVADPRELEIVRAELQSAAKDWDRLAKAATELEKDFSYRSPDPTARLLKQFTEDGMGWPAMNSMRSVDRVVRIRARGERG